VLGQVGLLSVGVVVGVDEFTAFDAITSLETLVDRVGESVGHVRVILSGGTDSLAEPVTVGSNELVVEVLDLVGGASADRVGVWVVGTSRGGRRGSGRSSGRSSGRGWDGSRWGGSSRRGRRLRGLGRLRLWGSTSPWKLGLLVSTEADIQAVSGEDRLAFDGISTIPERLQYQHTVCGRSLE